MTVVAITGHRPEKINDMEWVRSALQEVLKTLEPEKLIQGMAAGVDLLSAEVAGELNIPFIAARPWVGHTPRVADLQRYQWTMDNALQIVNVHYSQSYLGPWQYQQRNEYMVDNATIVVAVWDGTAGGTKNCVKYAQKNNLPVVRIDPLKKTISYPEKPSADTTAYLF